jgi:hypothetical protein
MRRALLVATMLLLAACNNRGVYENEQAELANELNPSSSQPNDENATASAAEEVNVTAGNATAGNAAANDVNSAAPSNEAAPQD